MNTKFCISCGEENLEMARFCCKCGFKIEDIKPKSDSAQATSRTINRPIPLASNPDDEISLTEGKSLVNIMLDMLQPQLQSSKGIKFEHAVNSDVGGVGRKALPKRGSEFKEKSGKAILRKHGGNARRPHAQDNES